MLEAPKVKIPKFEEVKKFKNEINNKIYYAFITHINSVHPFRMTTIYYCTSNYTFIQLINTQRKRKVYC